MNNNQTQRPESEAQVAASWQRDSTC